MIQEYKLVFYTVVGGVKVAINEPGIVMKKTSAVAVNSQAMSPEFINFASKLLGASLSRILILSLKLMTRFFNLATSCK